MGTTAALGKPEAKSTIYRILFAISLVHLLNDTMQAVIPAMLPILKDSMNLQYYQIGLIGFALNMTSSVMQPVVGLYTDKRPTPALLPLGMAASFIGMLGLGLAPNFWIVLLSASLVGIGSAVFHPEGSRVAYMAAGPRRGLAQSIYQVGGNAGQSLAPILTMWIFAPFGQTGVLWFTIVAAGAILMQAYVASWYKTELAVRPAIKKRSSSAKISTARRRSILFAICMLIFLVFCRSWYHGAVSVYYPFYLIDVYGLNVQSAQPYIFLFLAAGAVGTFFGGPLADKFGRRNIIFFSMIGSAPLALLLPYAGTYWAYPLLLVNGFILLSSFSVAVVYAQELVPGHIGTVSGLIVGLAFGMGAIGAVALGNLADWMGIEFVMKAASFLPLLGIATILLPSDRKLAEWSSESE
jgi:MFS transporter, FSR family, fosmidomycin resistance protein